MSGGDVFVLFVLVVFTLAVFFGLFTTTGSGIAEHPWRKGGDAPGASGPDDRSGVDPRERTPWTRGTK